MLNLYSDPDGKRIFDKSNPTDTHCTPNKDQKSGAEMVKLQNKVQEQEESIRIRDKKISELEKTLMNIEV